MPDKKLNILFMNHGAKLIGGGNFDVLFLMKFLDRSRFKVFLASTTENFFTQEAKRMGVEILLLPINKQITSVYRTKIIYSPFFILKSIFYSLVSVIKTVRLIRRYQIDIVHPSDNVTVIIGGLAAKLTRRAAVCRVTDELDDSLLINRLLKLMIVLSMSRVIAISENIRQLFAFAGKVPDKVVTVYNWVDLKLFDPEKTADAGIRKELGIQKEKFLISMIGLLIPIKGHKILLQALKALKEEGWGNITCLIVGDGPEEQKIKEFAAEVNLKREIIFSGFRKDIPGILKETDVLVLPSFTEAFPRVVLEAMAMGVPVVATRVGGVSEAIVEGKTGILIPPDDYHSLTKGIKQLLNDKQLRKDMGINARIRAQRLFSCEENILKTENIYLELLNN